jgi:hypothetical protein
MCAACATCRRKTPAEAGVRLAIGRGQPTHIARPDRDSVAQLLICNICNPKTGLTLSGAPLCSPRFCAVFSGRGHVICIGQGDAVVVGAETLRMKLRGQLETIEKGLAWLKDGTLSAAGAVTGSKTGREVELIARYERVITTLKGNAIRTRLTGARRGQWASSR